MLLFSSFIAQNKRNECIFLSPSPYRRTYPPGMHVLVKGFVDNMPELMCASDVIITKAGPGTISEALICGLPMVLNAFVPCQEEGNIPYVVDNGVGQFERRPMATADIIKRWLAAGSAKLEKMAAKAKAMGKPDALSDIVRDLYDLASAPATTRLPAAS
jgi:1,2-diacylglycerol 3-beta-galactosyltransferase